MVDTPPGVPGEPPTVAARRSPWPWVWGALGGAAAIAVAVALVVVLVPENHHGFVSGPIFDPSPSAATTQAPPSVPASTVPALTRPAETPASASVAPSPTGPPPVELNLSPTDPQAALKKQIAARWAAYHWEAENLLISFSDDTSAFASVATGQLEASFINGAAKLHHDGEYQVGRSTYADVKVDLVDSAMAHVTACIDSNGTADYKAVAMTTDPATHEVRVTESQLVQQVSGPKYVMRTTMRLIDGRWMASGDVLVANC